MKIIFPILSILIAILTFIYAINPFYKDVSLLKSDIVVYNAALDNSTDLQKKEDELIKSYNSIREVDKNRLNSLLPNEVNNIQFILEIERIANIHNMPIKDIKFDQVKAAPGASIVTSGVPTDSRPFGVFPIQFTTEGNYSDFTLFLKDLETNLRLADLRSVSFVVPAATSTDTNITTATIGAVDPNIYKYSLKLETYWLK
jgi:hypothetical protein